MIIEAKSSQQQQANEADPKKRFEFNAPEKATRLPAYLGLLFVGIAAYIKSAFPTEAQDHAPGAASGNPSANSGAPRGVRSEPGGPGVDTMTTGGIDEDRPNGSVGPAARPWDEAFSMPDPIAFQYTATSFGFLGPNVAPFFPAAVNYHPQNDNAAAPVQTGAPASIRPNPPSGTNTPPTETGDEDPDTDPDDDDDDDDQSETNRAPTVLGPVRLNDVFAGQVVLIGLSQLLFGASDPDGDTLTINDLTATGGTLVSTGNGWSLTTLPGMLGTVTFSYAISDGLLDIVQTATLDITRNHVTLTPQDDVYAGTPWDDDIDALAGDDVIDARAGNDSVTGGLGDDHINGGDGDDQLFGNDGDDVIFGGRGHDLIGGGAGNDRLFGEAGNDIIEGNDGDDFISGGEGKDIIDGGTGDDTLNGDQGDDTIMAGAGNDTATGGDGDDIIHGDDGDDTISGGAGDDVIDGGTGNDMLHGGAGDDILIGDAGDDEIHGDDGDDQIAAGEGDDDIDGGAGHDVLDYSDAGDDLFVSFVDGVATGSEIGNDTFRNIEEAVGGGGNDTFVIGAKATVVTGGSGDDLFIFTVTDETPSLSRQLVHEILDFVVGDRIRVADYDISRRAERLEEERFEEFYDELEDGFEEDLPIRVSYAFYDDIDHTIIEADVDRDDFYEISITLQGVKIPLEIDSHMA